MAIKHKHKQRCHHQEQSRLRIQVLARLLDFEAREQLVKVVVSLEQPKLGLNSFVDNVKLLGEFTLEVSS